MAADDIRKFIAKIRGKLEALTRKVDTLSAAKVESIKTNHATRVRDLPVCVSYFNPLPLLTTVPVPYLFAHCYSDYQSHFLWFPEPGLSDLFVQAAYQAAYQSTYPSGHPSCPPSGLQGDVSLLTVQCLT